MFAAVGVIWTFIELLDFFGIYQQAQYSKYAIIPVLGAGILFAVASPIRVSPIGMYQRAVRNAALVTGVSRGGAL